MVIAGTSKCLGWQYPVLLFVLVVHSVDFVSIQSLSSQHSPFKLVFGLYSYPTLILYSNLCPPFHPLSIPDTTLLVQLAKFSILIGRNFYKQQLVLEKLSNTMKWFTICVSFIHVLKIFGWLWRFKIFKIDYLVTSIV